MTAEQRIIDAAYAFIRADQAFTEIKRRYEPCDYQGTQSGRCFGRLDDLDTDGNELCEACKRNVEISKQRALLSIARTSALRKLRRAVAHALD